MKKMLLMLLMSMILFVQCKKDEIQTDEKDEMIPVSFEWPLNSSRSDFTNVFSDGNIKWGNKNKIEYIYVSVGTTKSYFFSTIGKQLTVGELFELTADVTESEDKLLFTGMIPKSLLYNSKPCVLYYFGNNSKTGTGANVEDIYESVYGCLVGKKVVFSKQTGDINDLGDYHIAKLNAQAFTIMGEDKTTVGYKLNSSGLLENIMSVAMLDLTDETVLGGSATQLQSYKVEWDKENRCMVESFEYLEGGTYDVSNNAGEKSFIALLPNDKGTTLECGKGRYVFKNGIKSNYFYLERDGNGIEHSLPLKWEQP